LFQAQRLCKKVCRSCYEHLKPTDAEKRLFEAAQLPVPSYLVRGRGCPECNGRGLSGRVSIMETVPIEEGGDIYTAIEEGAPAGELRKLADKLGYKTLFGSALELAADQKIPMSEAIAHNPRIG
jgi:type IV pilus assembly protein PilB